MGKEPNPDGENVLIAVKWRKSHFHVNGWAQTTENGAWQVSYLTHQLEGFVEERGIHQMNHHIIRDDLHPSHGADYKWILHRMLDLDSEA